MEQTWPEAASSGASALWRRAGALIAGVAMSVGVASTFAADVKTLDLQIAQTPSPAMYGGSATYTVTLRNTSNKTVNNAGITVTAPSTGLGFAVAPSCALSTGLPCAASGSATSFAASGYQLPASGTLTITVGLFMPAAAMPAPSFVLNATGTSSNNAGGPSPSAYTTTTASYSTSFAPPPVAYPQIQTTIDHDSGNTVLWSTAPCGSVTERDCGATYYAQYLITVKNLDASNAVPATRPITLTVTGGAATFTDAFDCSAPCSRSGNVFTITGLGAGASTSFTVFFKSPMSPSNIDVTATASVDNPAHVLPAPATVSLQTVPTDAAIGTYSSLVPTVGGSAKAKNALDSNGNGPFSSRVDVPGYSLGNYARPINIVLKTTVGTTSCSSSSPQCLDTDVDVQSSGLPVTFGAPSAPLDGSQLVITMVREWTTLNRKPSSVFNATVWYTDEAGNRTNVKDCGSVDLRVADRCIAQRIDMTTSAKGVLTGGYVKFIIWARHNGKIGW